MSFLYCARHGARKRYAPILGGLLLLLPEIAAAQSLSLSDVLARAASRDLTVAVTEAQLQSVAAGVEQAKVGPRPVVGVDVEDFAGTGPYSPVDRSQATAFYERTWERGGKRDARINAARSEGSVTQQRGRIRTLDLLAQVQIAWVEALAADAQIVVAEERLATAQRVESEVARRVSRALDPLFAGERARTAVAQARIARDQAVTAANIARANLAAWWGGSADFQLDRSAFEHISSGTSSGDTPDIELLAAQRDAADARIRLEEAKGVSDPTLRAGVRHFGEGNEFALIVGGSIPLGSRQANRGNVERARADRLAAEAEMAVARVERERELRRLQAEQAMIATEVSRIDREILPSAQRAVTLVRDGFNRGGTAFTFLEVNQAQQAVIDARTRRIDLLRRLHLDGARIDRLIGRHSSLIASVENR